jgi:hypothetical protein
MAFVRLPAILLGSIIVGLSLPHVANVRFKAMISLGPAPGLGRKLLAPFNQPRDERDSRPSASRTSGRAEDLH